MSTLARQVVYNFLQIILLIVFTIWTLGAFLTLSRKKMFCRHSPPFPLSFFLSKRVKTENISETIKICILGFDVVTRQKPRTGGTNCLWFFFDFFLLNLHLIKLGPIRPYQIFHVNDFGFVSFSLHFYLKTGTNSSRSNISC